MQRKSNSVFNPKATISILKEERNHNEPLDEKGRRLLVERYVEFKELMEKLDPAESESDFEDKLTANKVTKDSSSSKPTVNNVHTDSNLNPNEVRSEVINTFQSYLMFTLPLSLPKDTKCCFKWRWSSDTDKGDTSCGCKQKLS